MTSSTATGTLPKNRAGNGVTTPSRRGGSGRVLADVIVDLGFVARDVMDDATAKAHASGSAAERVLLASGALDEAGLSRAVAERFGLDHLDLTVYRVDPDAVKLVTPAAIRR
jgi:type IV pilus assembly protein PilB